MPKNIAIVNLLQVIGSTFNGFLICCMGYDLNVKRKDDKTVLGIERLRAAHRWKSGTCKEKDSRAPTPSSPSDFFHPLPIHIHYQLWSEATEAAELAHSLCSSVQIYKSKKYIFIIKYFFSQNFSPSYFSSF